MMKTMGVRIKAIIEHSLTNSTKISCFSLQFPAWTLSDSKDWHKIDEINSHLTLQPGPVVQHVLTED